MDDICRYLCFVLFYFQKTAMTKRSNAIIVPREWRMVETLQNESS